MKILHGDALTVLRTMDAESVHCCVTSPPYWGLRDYGVAGQLGLERTPEVYISRMVEVFREVRRVLRSDGTCWINIGDSYAGSWGSQGRDQGTSPTNMHARQVAAAARKQTNTGTITSPGLKPKDLVGIPWMLAFALRADGWYLRSEIIWSKPNPMPESVRDRPTKAHEQIFLLAKSQQYWYDADAIKEPVSGGAHDPGERSGNGAKHSSSPNGFIRDKCSYDVMPATRNKRTVWTVSTMPTPEAHFATYPIDLIEPCILAGCPAGGVVLDPFCGAGTTGMAALKHGRDFIGVELSAAYIEIARERLMKRMPLFAQL